MRVGFRMARNASIYVHRPPASSSWPARNRSRACTPDRAALDQRYCRRAARAAALTGVQFADRRARNPRARHAEVPAEPTRRSSAEPATHWPSFSTSAAPAPLDVPGRYAIASRQFPTPYSATTWRRNRARHAITCGTVVAALRKNVESGGRTASRWHKIGATCLAGKAQHGQNSQFSNDRLARVSGSATVPADRSTRGGAKARLDFARGNGGDAGGSGTDRYRRAQRAGGQFGDFGSADAEAHVDCRGLHILPGVIDSQVHFREPGLEYKEDIATGTAAAAMGGVTAVFEMPNTKPPTVSADDLADKCRRAAGRAWVDIAFFIGATPENIGELAALEQLPGCAGVKMFMGSSTGSLLVAEDAAVAEVLSRGSRRVAVHAEDEDAYARAIPSSKAACVSACRMARRADGVRRDPAATDAGQARQAARARPARLDGGRDEPAARAS